MMEETIMNAERSAENVTTPAISETDRRIRRWSFASYLSFGGGILAASAGIILGAESYVGMLTDAGTVNGIANFLIIAAFPLMMIGAHSLDRLAELRAAQKNNP
jgi:hypothetical protein